MNDDDDVTVLQPPPVRGMGRAREPRCDPPELASIPLPRWPRRGGNFTAEQAQLVRQRVLEHVLLHTQPTYRFLGMLEAMSGGDLRIADLVHVERGTLARVVKQEAATQLPEPEAAAPGTPVTYGTDDIMEIMNRALDQVARSDNTWELVRDEIEQRMLELEIELADQRARTEALEARLAQGVGDKPPPPTATRDQEPGSETAQQQRRELGVTEQLIGDAFGDRNKALRERVTVHLLLTSFTLGLLEVARDELAEMVPARVRPLRLCALMHSFSSGVASHFAKYCIRVWQRQGRPAPFSAGGGGDGVVIQSRKTRYNYAAEKGAFEADREYFGRLRYRPDGTLTVTHHGPTLDPSHLPDGVYVQSPGLASAANLPSYRRFRIERTRQVLQHLGGGARPSYSGNGTRSLVGGTVMRRRRDAPAFAPVHYAPRTWSD